MPLELATPVILLRGSPVPAVGEKGLFQAYDLQPTPGSAARKPGLCVLQLTFLLLSLRLAT